MVGVRIRYSNESLTGLAYPFGYFPVGTVAYFHCASYGYHLSENITRTCNTAGEWDLENPECIQSKQITLFFTFFGIQTILYQLHI